MESAGIQVTEPDMASALIRVVEAATAAVACSVDGAIALPAVTPAAPMPMVMAVMVAMVTLATVPSAAEVADNPMVTVDVAAVGVGIGQPLAAAAVWRFPW